MVYFIDLCLSYVYFVAMICSDAFFINGTSATLISPCVSLFCTKKLKKITPLTLKNCLFPVSWRWILVQKAITYPTKCVSILFGAIVFNNQNLNSSFLTKLIYVSIKVLSNKSIKIYSVGQYFLRPNMKNISSRT